MSEFNHIGRYFTPEGDQLELVSDGAGFGQLRHQHATGQRELLASGSFDLVLEGFVDRLRAHYGLAPQEGCPEVAAEEAARAHPELDLEGSTFPVLGGNPLDAPIVLPAETPAEMVRAQAAIADDRIPEYFAWVAEEKAKPHGIFGIFRRRRR